MKKSIPHKKSHIKDKFKKRVKKNTPFLMMLKENILKMKRYNSINPSISPNLEMLDFTNAIKLLFFPFSLRNGDYIAKVESWFKYNFSSRFAYSFSSGREAEYALLKAIGIKKDDGVLVQSFTCVASIYPILWLNAKPIFVDIDKETFSMDIKDLEKKITKNIKAIIVQHTFGIPANIEEIKKITKKNKIFLIEDCAHVIGGHYKNKKLGTWGDAAFFSFGRDKPVSSVYGGIAITNKVKIAEQVKKIKDKSFFPSHFWIYKQLLHPILTFFIISAFNVHPLLGKILLRMIKKIHLISMPVVPEKTYYSQIIRTKKYPNALAMLCWSQLMRLNKFNKNRVNAYRKYEKELIKLKDKIKFPSFKAAYLRIPILIKVNDNKLLDKEKEKLLSFCKKESIYLGDWYSNTIDPKSTDFNRIFYKKGSCKTAEYIALSVLNLPCHPTLKEEDIERVSVIIKRYYENKQ